jgi:hypothetical protein
MDYIIVNDYLDFIPGASPIRPEFYTIMKDASKRKVDMLIFTALAHFNQEGTRNAIHARLLWIAYNHTKNNTSIHMASLRL